VTRVTQEHEVLVFAARFELAAKERGMINFSAVNLNPVLGRIVRYPFRILPRDIAVPILQGPLRGKKWIVGSHLHGCWLGSYELEMQKRVAKEVKRGGVFYDIGANVGFYSILAATLSDPGLVYAFEPVPTNLVYLRKHLELNRIHNVEIFDMAISDEVGRAFFEVEDSRAMGRLCESGCLGVRTSTLDALLREKKVPPPDCIKMDIEGEEFHALLGAKNCFARYRPKLLLATHGRDVHDQCCQILQSWQYDFEHTSPQRDSLFAFPRLERQKS
jgi:FkbM family methyltransferase